MGPVRKQIAQSYQRVFMEVVVAEALSCAHNAHKHASIEPIRNPFILLESKGGRAKLLYKGWQVSPSLLLIWALPSYSVHFSSEQCFALNLTLDISSHFLALPIFAISWTRLFSSFAFSMVINSILILISVPWRFFPSFSYRSDYFWTKYKEKGKY